LKSRDLANLLLQTPGQTSGTAEQSGRICGHNAWQEENHSKKDRQWSDEISMTPWFVLRPLRFFFATFAVKGLSSPYVTHANLKRQRSQKKNRKGRKGTSGRLG
jgi:hypothetical protein